LQAGELGAVLGAVVPGAFKPGNWLSGEGALKRKGEKRRMAGMKTGSEKKA